GAAEDTAAGAGNGGAIEIQCRVAGRAACQGADIGAAGREDAGEPETCHLDADFGPRRCDCAVAPRGRVDFQRPRFFDRDVVVAAFGEAQAGDAGFGCDAGPVAFDFALQARFLAGDVDDAVQDGFALDFGFDRRCFAFGGCEG